MDFPIDADIARDCNGPSGIRWNYVLRHALTRQFAADARTVWDPPTFEDEEEPLPIPDGFGPFDSHCLRSFVRATLRIAAHNTGISWYGESRLRRMWLVQPVQLGHDPDNPWRPMPSPVLNGIRPALEGSGHTVAQGWIHSGGRKHDSINGLGVCLSVHEQHSSYGPDYEYLWVPPPPLAVAGDYCRWTEMYNLVRAGQYDIAADRMCDLDCPESYRYADIWRASPRVAYLSALWLKRTYDRHSPEIVAANLKAFQAYDFDTVDFIEPDEAVARIVETGGMRLTMTTTFTLPNPRGTVHGTAD